MRNVKDRLRSIAQQGRLGACIRSFLRDEETLRKGGCYVIRERRDTEKTVIIRVYWGDPNGPFASELKEIADKANAKKSNQSQDAE